MKTKKQFLKKRAFAEITLVVVLVALAIMIAGSLIVLGNKSVESGDKMGDKIIDLTSDYLGEPE